MSIFTSSASSILNDLSSGNIIFDTIILPRGTNDPPINKYCIGIPIAAYPISTVADILPIPEIKTSIISLSVIFFKYLLTSIGDSVCPRNILAVATKLSTFEVPSILPIIPPITLTTAPIIPR